MNLFKGKEKEEATTKEASGFSSLSVETSDLGKQIDKVAQEYGIPAKIIDFKILSYRTFYRKKGEKKYRELKPEACVDFKSSPLATDPDVELRQQIKAELFKKGSRPSCPVKMVIGGNKSLTKIYLSFKKQKVMQFSETIEREILEEIERKKAKLGLLLGPFNEAVQEAVSRVVSSIRVNREIEEDIRILLCEGIEPAAPAPAQIIYHYKFSKSEEMNEDIQIDYADRGYMHTVEEGDLVLECSKPHEGRVGRNCRGEILPPPKTAVELSETCEDIVAQEGVRVEEDEQRIRYIATRKGYINEPQPNHLTVTDELVIDEVSFRTTGSITAGDDKDVKIHIQNQDEFADSIGSGVRVETTELKTMGNVGSGAVVQVKKAQIGGQTHQSSEIYAHEATIQLHKGFVEADRVQIEILEGGKVVADTVYINRLSGGEIYAKEVHIQSVLSNALVKASDLIELDSVQGEGNRFIIDPTAQRGFAQKVQKIETDLKEHRIQMEQLTQKIRKLRAKIHNEKETIDQINTRLSELREQGVKLPEALLNKLKEHQRMIKEHNLLLKELKDVKIEKERLKNELQAIQASVFDAKVINHSVWKEFNEIKFMILNPPVEAVHLPKEGEMSEEITLSQTEEGEFILNRKGE